MLTCEYNIAGWGIKIIMEKTDAITNIGLLSSLSVFKSDGNADDLLTLTVCESLTPIEKELRRKIREFDTGNGVIIVERLNDGGYQYVVKDIFHKECALVITNADFTDCRCMLQGNFNERLFGINNTLMLVYAFAASFHNTLLIHASVIKKGEKAYAFIAKSGTGKSTQVANWLKAVDGCEILNDDNPIVRILPDGTVRIYGSPWSGKTPCYRNRHAALGGIIRIERATENSMERLSPLTAFASFLPSCSSMKWEKSLYDRLINTVSSIIEKVPIYTLHCLPDEASALVCYDTLIKLPLSR